MSFLEIFQPGLRHLREERDRQKMTVSKPTPGGGAPLGIDLEAGVARIRITRPAPAAEPEEHQPDEGQAQQGQPADEDPEPHQL